MNRRYTLLALLLINCFNLNAQDDCTTATDVGSLGCGEAITVNFNNGDTPDTEAVGCMSGVNGTWYSFFY